ncbi:hypothetical protein GYB22_03470 [bacterium]|nr:hypothetical protein [bacterium]
MKPFLSLLFTSVLFLGTTAFSSPNDTKVYLCTGPDSYAYHFKKNCRGLSNCSTALKESTESEAKELGRKLCGWED